MGVIDDGISHQRVHHTLQVANAAIGCLSDILDDIGWNLQTVTTALGIEDVDAQLHIGLLEFGDQTTGKTREQTFLHTLKIHRRTVRGKNDLLANAEQVVEDMEESIERLGRVHPLLDIIDDQHIDALVEVNEVVGGIVTHGVGVLHLKETCRDIEHPLLRIGLLTAHTNGIDQMRLSAT